MKSLSNFSSNVLNRTQMKTISGGGCAVCSSGGPGGNSGTCGTMSMSKADAKALAAELNASGDGYSYSVTCTMGAQQ